MKKFALLVLAVIILTGSAPAAGRRFIFNLYSNYLSLPANSFTGQASEQKIFLEAKAAAAISGNIYLWASHGWFPLHDSWTGWSGKGSFAKDIQTERTLAKRIIAGGGGIFFGYFEPSQIAVRIEAGVCGIANAIEAKVSKIDTSEFVSAAESRQSALGLRGNLAFTYGFYRNVFAEISGGYMLAPDKIGDVSNNLGGFHLALGLGIQL